MNTMLPIFFWVLVLLSIVGAFGPSTWELRYRFTPVILLIIMLGLRVFRLP